MNEQIMEASSPEPCDVCGAKSWDHDKFLHENPSEPTEITGWTAHCKCGRKTIILND